MHRGIPTNHFLVVGKHNASWFLMRQIFYLGPDVLTFILLQTLANLGLHRIIHQKVLILFTLQNNWTKMTFEGFRRYLGLAACIHGRIIVHQKSGFFFVFIKQQTWPKSKEKSWVNLGTKHNNKLIDQRYLYILQVTQLQHSLWHPNCIMHVREGTVFEISKLK